MDSQTNIKGIVSTTWVGLVANLFLAIFKIISGMLGHSYAVVADGLHSFSDIIVDITLLIGVRYWSAPPDEEHPYGHGRLEHIVSFIIAIILALTAVSIVYGSTVNYIYEKPQQTKGIAVFAAICAILVKEGLYRWTAAKAKKHKSAALMANAWHHRSDALSSTPAAIAAGLTSLDPDLVVVDLIGAIVVAIFIAFAAWKIARPAVFILIDGSADRRLRKKILLAAYNVNGVKNVHALRTRFLGQGLDINLHVMVDADITVEEGHNIAEEVKNALIKLDEDILDVTVHVEPWRPPQKATQEKQTL